MPPPSVRPPTPVDARKPERVAMPNQTVAWSTSPQVHPASARTVWFSGLTVVLRSNEVDDQGVIPYPEAAGVVTATSHGDLDVVSTAET